VWKRGGVPRRAGLSERGDAGLSERGDAGLSERGDAGLSERGDAGCGLGTYRIGAYKM